MSRIPKLRFKEFNRDWEIKQGYELFHNSRKKGKEGLPIYSVTLKNGLVPRDSLERVIGANAATELNLFAKKGDIVYNMMRMWQGACGQAMIDCMVSPAYVVLSTKQNVNSDFFSYLFQRPRCIYNFWAYSYGLTSDRLRLYAKDFGVIRFKLPKIDEQQKIASFLSTIDTKINQLSRKKKLLEQYKKGLMQKIFLQELRFKDDDGSAFPEWEEKQLKQLGVTYNGLTGKTADDFGTGKPYIQYKQIFDKSKIDIKNFGYVDIKPNDKQNKAQYGDVFFTVSSETPAEVGFASVLLDHIEDVYLNSFCFGFRTSNITLNPLFSQYVFRSASFRKDVIKLAQGSTRYNISKTEFMKITISLPSIHEQTKIANFLSAIDSKIDLVAQQLDEAKNFKKALLNQMFV